MNVQETFTALVLDNPVWKEHAAAARSVEELRQILQGCRDVARKTKVGPLEITPLVLEPFVQVELPRPQKLDLRAVAQKLYAAR